MIPESYDKLSGEFTVGVYPTKTYDIKFDDEVMSGKTDRLEAMKQAIYKILFTDRYKYIIYSYNYGVELNDLIGKSFGYVCSVVKQRITEALMQDDRISKVYDFVLTPNKKNKSLLVEFKVDTTEGTAEISKEVNMGTNGEGKLSINFVVNLPSPHVSKDKSDTEKVKPHQNIKEVLPSPQFPYIEGVEKRFSTPLGTFVSKDKNGEGETTKLFGGVSPSPQTKVPLH